MKFVLDLAGLDRHSLSTAGGKGANLGELLLTGFPVPPGFCVTTAAYDAFVSGRGLTSQITSLASSARPDDPAALEQVSGQIRTLFEEHDLPDQVAAETDEAYTALCGQDASDPIPVAVRSSATAEDLPDLSFAGQQDTYLNVIGREAVLDAVRRCWASLWTARAIGYRSRGQIDPAGISIAVIVQVMVPAEAAGVLFTANPLTGRRSEAVIDAAFGLGEALVSGQVEPDHYVVDLSAGRVLAKTLGSKAISIHSRPAGGTHTLTKDAGPIHAGTRQALDDRIILDLARLGQQVADHFGGPQDIEWALADHQLFLVQSRPVTSLFPIPSRLNPSGPLKLMFSFGSVQGMLDPLTPLGREVYAGLAAVFAGRFNQAVTPETQQIIYTAAERLFINCTGMERHPVGREVVKSWSAREQIPAGHRSSWLPAAW